MTFGLRIFDRYIWRQVFGSTLTGVIVLTGVMVLGNVFKEMERLLGDTSSLPLSAVAEFIGFVIPYSLIFTIPWALLTAILLVFGRMSADNEMTSLRMTGMAMWRICAPVFLLSGLLCVTCYYVNVYLAPFAKSRIKSIFYDLALDKPEMLFQQGKVLDKFPGYRIYTAEREDKKLKGVEITQTDEGLEQLYIRAHRAEVEVSPGVVDFTLRLHDAHFEQPKGKVEGGLVDVLNDLQSGNLKEMPMTFPLSQLKEKTDRVTDSMRDTATLWKEVKTGDEAVTGRKLAVNEICSALTEVNMRYSFSLACLTFTLVGIPLGITAQRRETSIGFALSLGVATCYIVFILIAKHLNEDPNVHPEVIMWMPNVVFLIVGGVLFWRLSRR
jgi:lipopolysaccharide export LptBFGC system permease protein LptF